MTTPLFCYRHSPYQQEQPQHLALELKSLVSKIKKIQQDVESFSSHHSAHPAPFFASHCLLETQTQTASGPEKKELLALETFVISLEKQLKSEKEKTHQAACRILLQYKKKFQEEEKILNEKIKNLHEIIDRSQLQTKQKKALQHIKELEQEIPYLSSKISKQQISLDQLYKELALEINIIRSAFVLAASQHETSLSQIATTPPIEEPAQALPPCATEPSLQAEDDQLRFVLQRIETKKGNTLKLTEFSKEEFFIMLRNCFLDCLKNPFSDYYLAEKPKDTKIFSLKTNKELVLEIGPFLKSKKLRTTFLDSLEKEEREILLINKITGSRTSIKEIIRSIN